MIMSHHLHTYLRPLEHVVLTYSYYGVPVTSFPTCVKTRSPISSNRKFYLAVTEKIKSKTAHTAISLKEYNQSEECSTQFARNAFTMSAFTFDK